MLIDEDKFHENIEFLEEAILFIIDHYLEHYPVRTKVIEEGMATSNFEQIARAAHSMKNDISQFYAQIVYDNAIELESAASEGNMTQVKSSFNEYHQLHQYLHDEIRILKDMYEQKYKK